MFPGRANPRQPPVDLHHDPPNDGPWRQACQPEGPQGVSGPSLTAQLGLESSLPGLYPSLPVDPNPGHDPSDDPDPDPDPFLPGTWVPNSPEPVKRQVQNRNPCAIYLELREQLEAVGPLTREDHALLKNFLDLSDDALQRRILEKKLEEFGREKVDRPFPKFGKRFPYNDLRIAAAKRAEDERKRQAEIQELNRRHKERIEAERLERRRAEMQRQREEAERVQREREEAERLRREREEEEHRRREREEEEHRRREREEEHRIQEEILKRQREKRDKAARWAGPSGEKRRMLHLRMRSQLQMTGSSAAELSFEIYHEKWALLKEVPDGSAEFCEFPWPVISSAIRSVEELTKARVKEFVFHDLRKGLDGKSKSERVRAREEILLWHPDKFNLLPKARACDRGQVEEAAGIVARILTNLL